MATPLNRLDTVTTDSETQEIAELILQLESDPQYDTLEKLAVASVSDLANTIKNFRTTFNSPWFSVYWTNSVKPIAEDHYTNNGTVTDDEQYITTFLNRFHKDKRDMVEAHFEGRRDYLLSLNASVFNSKIGCFENFRRLNTGDFRVEGSIVQVTGDFYNAAATYYIALANEIVNPDNGDGGNGGNGGNETERDSFSYTYTGKVENQDTGVALANYQVSLFDPRNAENILLGKVLTNHQGYFRVAFQSSTEINNGAQLEVQITGVGIASPVTETVSFDTTLGEQPQTTIAVRVNSISQPSSTISEVEAEIGNATSNVRTLLNNLGVSELADVRNIGGLSNQDISGYSENELAYLEKLDALANLELVSDDLVLNNALASKGYNNIAQIANATQSDFVSKNDGISSISRFEVAQIHFKAKAAHRFALNKMVNDQSNRADGLSGSNTHEESCGCQDCNSAVSPMAYLTDLLNFAFNNIKTGNQANSPLVDLAFLENNLFQNLGDLPVNCEQLNNSLCQNRISIEVLRAYYASFNTDTEIENRLTGKVKFYTNEVYKLILNSLGTSYEEVRGARAISDPDERKKITDRIGISLGESNPATDHLAQLFIDISGNSNISESDLESIFGLRNSEREPLTATPVSLIETWKAQYLRELWQIQDHVSNAYNDRQEVIIDPDVVSIDDLRSVTEGKAQELWHKRRAWQDSVFNHFESQIILTPSNFLKPIDNVIATTLEVAELYPEGSTVRYNGSDYTLIYQYLIDGLTHFKVSELIADDEVDGGDITINPDSDNNTIENENVTIRSAAQMMNQDQDDFEDLTYEGNADSALGFDNTYIAGLRTTLVAAKSGDTIALESLDEDGMTIARASRWIELYDKNQLNPNRVDIEGNLTEAEWFEFINIFVSLFKFEQKSYWIDEEVDENITLDAKSFWIAVNSPRIDKKVLNNEHIPYIDPQLISLDELLEVTARGTYMVDGNNALAVYNSRKETLETFRNGLNGLSAEDLINQFPTTLYTWDAEGLFGTYQWLRNELNDPVNSSLATHNIQNLLQIEVADFQFLVDILSLENGEASESDLSRVKNIITKWHKVANLYSTWAGEEPTEAWKTRKVGLINHLATPEQRVLWERALDQNNSAPIIDATLVGPADLKSIDPNDTAFQLWEQRFIQMRGTSGFIDSINPNLIATLGNYDMLVKDILGLEESNIAVLEEQRQNSIDISARLKQLDLLTSEFNYLIAVRDILAASGSPTQEEVTNVRRILANTQKRKEFFQYKQEEITADISHSQDHFIIPETPLGTFPAEEPYELLEWLATSREKREWQKLLEGRIDQENTVKEAHGEVIFSADEAMLIHLRDALVNACLSLSGIESAKDLGDKLLIELENNCCFKTNRVAQAIETLQQLIWKQRAGLLEASYPDLESIADDFDSAWTWMGNYANWRAAMFVFLYPENVLIPSLRNNQSEGFQQVIEATRNNRRFNPREACEVVNNMTEYLKDVSNLRAVATVRARGQLEYSCKSDSNSLKPLFFTFAESNESTNSYYCITEVDVIDNMTLKDWKKVPGLPKGAILKGADVYDRIDNDDINHVYLFYMKSKDEQKNKFYALRYELENGKWLDEELEFEIERDNLSLDVDATMIPLAVTEADNIWEHRENLREHVELEIRALKIMQNNHPWLTPAIAVSLDFKIDSSTVATEIASEVNYNPLTFTNYLDKNGIELRKTREWRAAIKEDRTTLGLLMDHVSEDVSTSDSDGLSYLFLMKNTRTLFGSGSNVIYYLQSLEVISCNWLISSENIFSKLLGVPEQTVDITLSGGLLVKAPLFEIRTLKIPNSSKVLVNFLDNTINTEVVFNAGQEESMTTDVSSFLTTGKYVDYCGHYKSLNHRPIVIQNTESSEMTLMKVSEDAGDIIYEHPQLMTPTFSDFTVFSQVVNEPHLALRASVSNSDYLANNTSALRRYVEEAYYFTPLQVALQLTATGHYLEALDWFRTMYDYTQPLSDRKICHGLILEESIENLVDRVSDWYADPLNPHAIASNRTHAYTRYTINAIAQCMLNYADAEFTKDNAESVPRARELYERALDLLDLLKPENPCPADEYIFDLTALIGNTMHSRPAHSIIQGLSDITDNDVLDGLNGAIDGILRGVPDNNNPLDFDDQAFDDQNAIAKLNQIKSLIDSAIVAQGKATRLSEKMEQAKTQANNQINKALNGGDLAIINMANVAEKSFSSTLQKMTGFDEEDLKKEPLTWLTDPKADLVVAPGYEPDVMRQNKNNAHKDFGIKDPKVVFLINSPFPDIVISGMPFTFCVVPNPLVDAHCMRAFVNLFKIRNCMNIAGIVRELEPFAAPTDSTSGVPSIGVGGSLNIPSDVTMPPSNYRYSFLADRAKQLVAMSQQIESSFLTALEKFDAETYSILRAEQDVETSRANIKLQDLKVKEAKDAVKLSELQKERATIQINGLEDMIDQGLLANERILLASTIAAGLARASAIATELLKDVTSTAIDATGSSIVLQGIANTLNLSYAITATVGNGFRLAESAANLSASIASIYAGLERRQQEWNYQKSIAIQDQKIGDQQIKLAKDRVRIVGQEREMALLQNDHAKATLDFLKNKFTNAELYEWMSKILEDVYAFFLQEATAMALIAQRQLAFERQVELPPFIKTDYWVVDEGNIGGQSITGEQATDRRGLTGSSRLLKDLYELDQYAFNTNTPKQQISKTISLNEIAPIQMQELRDNGIMTFATTQDMFDRDYPGHYLRLIKRVSVTVIALNSPTRGIKATLTNGGISRVITGGNIFQERTIYRQPEQIALSAGVNDYGVFQLQPNGEFLQPFEGHGVETNWELRMEKAANPFDYQSIADVLITIEYEAMNSFNYRTAVVSKLNDEQSREQNLAISFKNNLPDQWFDLTNGVNNQSVSFNIAERDLVPNGEIGNVRNIAIYFAMKDGETYNGDVTLSKVMGDGTSMDGEASINGDLVSTAGTGGGGLIALLNNPILGEWNMSIDSDGNVLDENVEDIILVISYDTTPPQYTQS